MAPSQTGFSTTPIRGTGALAFNTAGNREEAVGYLVNGVTTNNLTFGSLGFPPPIASIQEFKVDNSTFSAEYGHVSGAIVNLVTRSGSDQFRGEAYEFFRNDALDARNFFEFTSADPHPFERNQFGGSLGGPIVRGRTFFFATYEGLRQRQGLDVNSLVLSDEQRARATDPVVRRLIELIPARERLRRRRHAAIRRRRRRRRRRKHLDRRPAAECRRHATASTCFVGRQQRARRSSRARRGRPFRDSATPRPIVKPCLTVDRHASCSDPGS